MSSVEQPVDSQLIEQTRRQIQALVAEIAQLAKQSVAPGEFYGEFLTRVVSALAAIGGAVWTLNDDGQLSLQFQINLQQTGLRESEEAQKRHGMLLYKALAAGEGLIVPPQSGFGEEDAANPTEFLLVIGPLRTDLEMVGLVEIFQRSEATPNVQQGYLRFLLQMCELAADFLKSHQLRHFSDRQVLWARLEDFTRMIHASLDPIETAYTIANEGRRLIECDRVSVAIRRGNRCTIEAVSGQDVFDKRSNTIRLLGRLASAVVATGDPVWYAGDTRDLAPQVEDAVQEYVDEAHSKMIAVLPLKRPPREEDDDPKTREEPEQPVGALIVEQIEDSRVAPSLAQRVDVVCRHSATALANAMEHQSLFLMPVWRAIGKSRWLIKARTLPKTISISVAVLVLLVLLCIWPADFNLHSKGTLEPITRQDVFAGIDGIVDDVLVQHGDEVGEGHVLVRLRNVDVEVAKTQIDGELIAARQRVSSIQHAINDRQARPEDRQRLFGDLAEATEKELSLAAQQKIYADKIKHLEVCSPIRGVVVTWDLENRLQRRPVQRGQLLMRVANVTDPKANWQLELHMAEDRMGYIAKAQLERWAKTRLKLRDVLREVRAAREPDAVTEEINAAIDEEIEAMPNSELHAGILAALRDRLRQKLRPIAEQCDDEAVRAGLDAALAEESYEKARADLDALIKATTDKQTLAQLRKLPLDEPGDEMPVRYILANQPSAEHKGLVKEIQESAEVRGDEGNTVLIKVAIDKNDVPERRPGAAVTAKVYCGRRAIGYVWFHDLIAFVQSRVLFWLW